jgi:tRNA-dihydrouridine synthase C
MPTTLPFTSPWLLAPMEGVTEPCFRDVVLERNTPQELGGAFTEFLRVHRQALPKGKLQAHLGARRFPQPVGLQLMGSEEGPLAETADAGVRAGAPLIDINFGCPSKRATQGCAGSALLDYPEKVEAFVRVCVQAAAGRVPVTAKIRSGVNDDRRLEEVARAAVEGGAAMLTVHCRTKEEGYRDCADWRRVARAVAAVKVPVCGNGSIETHADLERMRRETGCQYAMVGRAALGNPWIFSGKRVDAEEAARFLLDYAERMQNGRRWGPSMVMGRVKRLISFWTAGDLFEGDTPRKRNDERRRWLTERDADRLWRWLAERAA